ncbi:uncharacterized protein LOC135400308 [Ornithodoros turicata]|uniref:uncharacterized protein LOC135400308 n=1 Tax=Ornithodoros turicata TaxID=34597 RepID=UPI0031389EBC
MTSAWSVSCWFLLLAASRATAAQPGASNEPIFSPALLASESYAWPSVNPVWSAHYRVINHWWHNGLWGYVARPAAADQRPDSDPPHAVTAILYGPTYIQGRGWTYGPAGTVLVPRQPPYVSPYDIHSRRGRPPGGNDGGTTETPQVAEVQPQPYRRGR